MVSHPTALRCPGLRGRWDGWHPRRIHPKTVAGTPYAARPHPIDQVDQWIWPTPRGQDRRSCDSRVGADVITKYLQSSDGKTGYQRLFGKQVHKEGLEFGEKVMYMLRRSQETNVVLDARWKTGYWLGRTWGSISNRIATSERTVIEARAVHRVPKPERWDLDGLNKLQATPWLWTVPECAATEDQPAVIAPRTEEEKALDPPRPVQEREYKPKRVYLMKTDMEKWGYTAGCRR